MLDGAVVIPLQSMFWNLMYECATLLWMVDRALLNVGYFILTLTGWLTQNVFAPLLNVVGQQTEQLVGPLFLIALTVLGFTYLLAVFGRFEVVNFRSAVMWLLFAATLYTFGPTFYTGLEDFRRMVGSGFYEVGVNAFNDASSATGLNAIGTMPSDVVATPSDQFGQFLPGVPGATAVDGLDVAMAYIGADGFDVLAAAGSPHPIARLPWSMVEAGSGSYFDPETGPNAFSSMSDAERQASIGRALQGVWRAFTTIFIAIFGIIEQLVNFIMAASFAVAFFSMFIAVLFGFFIRTEPIAWGALNLIIELFIHSIINSLLMSLILGFVLVGANTGNAILLLGASLVGLWMSWNLLQSALKGLVNSSERLYQSFSASTGGNVATVGETNKAVAEATLSAMSGASVMAGGGSLLQAAGATFGDGRTAQTMNYASRMLGGEATVLGSVATAIGEGAAAYSVAGPMGGYLLGRQSREQAQTDRRENLLSQHNIELTPQDGFSPDDARRVAQLVDSHDDDDFALLVNAVRNSEAGDTAGIQQALPPRLQATNPTDLDALARALPTPQIHIGQADRNRGMVVDAYRDGDESADILQQAFEPDLARDVQRLLDNYGRDNVDAIVNAVRRARTDDPDREPDTPSALRSTRRYLPTNLQQMPSSDLRTFARAFGTSAEIPTVGNLDGIARPRQRERREEPVTTNMQGIPLHQLSNMSSAQRIRLENQGITEMDQVIVKPAQQLANIARVDLQQAQQWQDEAIAQSLQTYTRQLQAGANA